MWVCPIPRDQTHDPRQPAASHRAHDDSQPGHVPSRSVTHTGCGSGRSRRSGITGRCCYTRVEAYGMSQPMQNTDPPGARCGMCGGKARMWHPGWIEYAGKGQPYPHDGEGRCSWSSHDPRRRKHRPYWRVRVWLGR
jgi:hypothetical protein